MKGENFVFITGMLRSGTTLLDKLLNGHPDLAIASQPYHNLYVYVKKLFLAARRQESNHLLPLSNQFMEDPSQKQLFQEMLFSYALSLDDLECMHEHATEGKGQGAPELVGKLQQLCGGTFISVWKNLHEIIRNVREENSQTVVGSKEVLCEEYIPYLAANGIKCILIIRDPRAVISSLNFGKYRDSVGDRYPLLLNIRNWRKSAAYFLHLSGATNVLVLRYEDLVCATEDTLARIANFLNIAPFPSGLLEADIVDQRGRPWTGNSSFAVRKRVDPTAVSTWRRVLDSKTASVIEFCTFPEICALGYEPEIQMDWNPSHLIEYEEDIQDVRSAYLGSYALDSRNKKMELLRRAVLLGQENVTTLVREKLFLFEDVFATLGQRLNIK